MLSLFDAVTLGSLLVVGVFVYWSGKDRMFSFTIINYLFVVFGLMVHRSLDYASTYLQALGSGKTAIGMTYFSLGELLHTTTLTIVIVLYIVVIYKTYRQTPLTLAPFSRDWIEHIMSLIVVVLCSYSFLFTVGSLFFGIDGLQISALEKIVGPLTDNLYIYGFFSLTPLWMALHGAATLGLLFSARLPTPSLSSMMDEEHHDQDGRGLM